METFLEEGYTSVYIVNAYNQRVGLRLTDRMDLESKDGEQRATPPSSSLIDILYIYMYAHTYRMEGWFRATSSVNNFPRIWRDRSTEEADRAGARLLHTVYGNEKRAVKTVAPRPRLEAVS